jgi:hypothetical protein
MKITFNGSPGPAVGAELELQIIAEDQAQLSTPASAVRGDREFQDGHESIIGEFRESVRA